MHVLYLFYTMSWNCVHDVMLCHHEQDEAGEGGEPAVEFINAEGDH